MTERPDDTLPFEQTGAPLGVQELNSRIPDLEVCQFIGRGGMGAVYRARQVRLDRDVALKVVLPSRAGGDFHDRFQMEARSMARLSHPNVVVVHDFGQVNDLDYLVMEFIRGRTLRHTVADGPVVPTTAYSIASQVCQALEYAHEQGVIHRDVKPENILVEPRGRARLADFGLARLLSTTLACDENRVVGTPGYMAPELFTCPADADHRADIYSMGAVIYEMLTGKRYQDGAPPPSMRGFPDTRMDEVVGRALQKDPDQRYQRACNVDEDVTSISRTNDSAVMVRETVPGTTQQVFRAWTDSQEAQRFLAPSDSMTTEFHEFSATVGGRFCLTMKGETKHTARGEYGRVKFPNTLSFTWSWDDEPVEPNETQVTIRLRPTDSGTEVLLIHERLSSRESRDRHGEGWTGVLSRLKRQLHEATP